MVQDIFYQLPGLIVRAVAGMFRAQALLSGQTFNLKAYLRALAGKM